MVRPRSLNIRDVLEGVRALQGEPGAKLWGATYQTLHGVAATIFAVFLQLKLLANSGKSLSTVFERYSSGACASLSAWLRNCSGRVYVHHCWA